MYLLVTGLQSVIFAAVAAGLIFGLAGRWDSCTIAGRSVLPRRTETGVASGPALDSLSRKCGRPLTSR